MRFGQGTTRQRADHGADAAESRAQDIAACQGRLCEGLTNRYPNGDAGGGADAHAHSVFLNAKFLAGMYYKNQFLGTGSLEDALHMIAGLQTYHESRETGHSKNRTR